LLTGLHPIRTGMQVGVMHADTPYGLNTNLTTIGDHFRALGYQTHLVGKWHQGFFLTEYMPTRRGFDSHFGYMTGHSDYFSRISATARFWGHDLYENLTPANLSKYAGQYSTDMYTDRVVELIDREKNATKPWLIYMAQ